MIYEIVCNLTGERYIGSTFEPTIARRITVHRKKSNDCCSKQIIERGNYSYGLLEKVEVNTRDELRMYERKWYDQLDCINKRRPYCSFDELKAYYDQNKDKIKEYGKAYREQNKDKKKEYMRAYRERKKNASQSNEKI